MKAKPFALLIPSIIGILIALSFVVGCGGSKKTQKSNAVTDSASSHFIDSGSVKKASSSSLQNETWFKESYKIPAWLFNLRSTKDSMFIHDTLWREPIEYTREGGTKSSEQKSETSDSNFYKKGDTTRLLKTVTINNVTKKGGWAWWIWTLIGAGIGFLFPHILSLSKRIVS